MGGKSLKDINTCTWNKTLLYRDGHSGKSDCKINLQMLCFTGKPGKNHRDFRQESGQNMHAWKSVLDGDHIDYLRDIMFYFRVVSVLPILQEGTTLGSANNPPLCNDFNLWSWKIWKWQSTEWLMQMERYCSLLMASNQAVGYLTINIDILY